MTARAVTEMTADDRLELQRLNQTRWWEQSACVGAPFEWFDTPRDAARLSATYRAKQEANAKALCATCPVIDPCRRDAELLKDPSIRGGMTRRERDNAARTAKDAS